MKTGIHVALKALPSSQNAGVRATRASGQASGSPDGGIAASRPARLVREPAFEGESPSG